MPVVKGQSGNPDGRPFGACNSNTPAAEALFQARAEEVVNFAVEKALAGNLGALRACLDRLLPPRPDRPVPFVLPPTVSAADTERAVADIRAAIGTGEITPREALALLQIVEKSVRIVAAARLAQRRVEQETAAEGAADPGASEPHCNQQPPKETMKYNEPPRSANGAAEVGSHGEEQRTERTMKYNEPLELDCTPVVRHETMDRVHSPLRKPVVGQSFAAASLPRIRRVVDRPAPSGGGDDCRPLQ
jgi:hypothetical protein